MDHDLIGAASPGTQPHAHCKPALELFEIFLAFWPPPPRPPGAAPDPDAVFPLAILASEAAGVRRRGKRGCGAAVGGSHALNAHRWLNEVQASSETPSTLLHGADFPAFKHLVLSGGISPEQGMCFGNDSSLGRAE